MRVLFALQPGLGHYYAMHPLIKAVESHDNVVSCLTSPTFAPLVQTGIEFLEAGPPWTEHDTEVQPFLEDRPHNQAAAFIRAVVNGSVEDTLRVYATWKPDLVIRDVTEYSSWIAAEVRHIPHASLSVCASHPNGRVLSLGSQELLQVLAKYNLQTGAALDNLSRYHLNTLPASFVRLSGFEAQHTFNYCPEVADLGDHLKMRQPSRWAGDQTWPDEHDLPTVVLCFGTVYNFYETLIIRIIEALEQLEVRIVVTTAGHNLGYSPRQCRNPLYITDYMPFGRLLSSASAIICHAGCNTLQAGFLAGVPSVMLPFSADQTFNAHATVDLGAGVSVTTHFVADEKFPTASPTLLDPQAIADATATVLGSSHYQAASFEVGAELRRRPLISSAAENIQAVVDKFP